MDEILIINISFCALNILFGFSICLIYYRNRFNQPFKSKHPFLVILSSSFCIIISVCFLLEKQNNLISQNFYYEISVFEAMSLSFVFIPLLIRSWLLIQICYVNSFHIRNSVECYMMPKLGIRKLHLLICTSFCIFFLLLFIILFNYDESIQPYFNYITFLYFLYFIEELILIFSLIILMDKDVQVNMKFELVFVLLVYFLMDLVFFIYEEIVEGNRNEQVILVISFYIKMLALFLCYIISPICLKEKIIANVEGPQCAQSLEKLLSSKIARNGFHYYLDSNNDIEGLTMLEIYESIKSYELEFNKEDASVNKNTITFAKKLIDAYIHTKPIFPKDVQETINFKFEHREITKTLFDQVYGIVINQLQGLYTKFIYTEDFKTTEEKLRKNEIIFERYKKVNLI